MKKQTKKALQHLINGRKRHNNLSRRRKIIKEDLQQ